MLAIDIDRAAVGRLDDWARNGYLRLISEVGEREFKREEAEEVLIKRGSGLENVGKLFSALRDAGLIDVTEDKRDRRRNAYDFILFSWGRRRKLGER